MMMVRIQEWFLVQKGGIIYYIKEGWEFKALTLCTEYVEEIREAFSCVFLNVLFELNQCILWSCCSC